MKTLEKILFALIILLLCLSAIQKEFKLFEVKELSGDFISVQKPEFQWASWYDGIFQTEFDKYLNDNNGFHSFLIRLNNQVDFSFYKEIHAEGVVAGYQKQYFEYDYIRSYTGRDYLGEEIIDRKIRKLKFLQNYLKDSLDIDLIFVLEPGKASYYPDLIHKQYLSSSQETNNYKEILSKSEKYNLPTIDFLSWYSSLRYSTPYPLYGQYGTHWNPLGMSYVADSLLKVIESVRGIELREVIVDTIIVENQSRVQDYDMAAAMNLLFRLKDQQALAYPEFRFGADTTDKDFPQVLVVGDSYYWNIYNARIPHNVFGNEDYWYFGKLAYPEHYFRPSFVEDLNIREEIEKQDVLLLMTTERFLYKFDWGLIDALYKLYGISSPYENLDKYISYILTNDEWFNNIIQKAEEQNKTLVETIIGDAKYSFWSEDPLTYAVRFGVEDIIIRMQKDQKWLAELSKKATLNKISLEEMTRRDALYDLSVNEPEAYEILMSIEHYNSEILNDSMLVEETRKQAAYYLLHFDEMLQIRAEQMLKKSKSDFSSNN